MLMIVTQIIGFLAVGLYLLSYQLKKRIHIVWVTFISNTFYVLQYLLLGAFSGAVMDILSTVASLFAARKNAPPFQKHKKIIVVSTLTIIFLVGIGIAILRRSYIELLPIAGAIFQTVSLWCDDEQTLRKWGLCATPFWLVYNFISKAYGASLGSLFALVSITVSLIRYRKKAES